MIEVRVRREVSRSAEEVFANRADWTNNPTWQKGMQSCTWTLPLDITREVVPRSDGGTTQSATIRGELPGPTKLFSGLARKMVERKVNADYDRLEALFDGIGGIGQ